MLGARHTTTEYFVSRNFIATFTRIYHWNFTQPEVSNPKYVIRFNLILPSEPLSPDLLFLKVPQSKSAKISELYSTMK